MYHPPTDNLYKFLAIAGVAFLIFIYHHTNELQNSLDLKMVEARSNIENTEKFSEILMNSLEFLSKNPPSGKSIKANLLFDEAVTKRKLQIHEQLIVTKNNVGQAEYISNKIDELQWEFTIGFVFSLVLILSGFSLWYFKVQRYEDKRTSM